MVRAGLVRLWHCDDIKAYNVANMLAWLLSGSQIMTLYRAPVWTNLAGILVLWTAALWLCLQEPLLIDDGTISLAPPSSKEIVIFSFVKTDQSQREIVFCNYCYPAESLSFISNCFQR